jgi:pimeloyl-ACP methyl ester carboxylesterase
VLIHGLGGSSAWWRHNVDVLAREHLVAAVDLAGFGRNRFPDIAALLARWIETSFTERVHLAGNSMGGHLAIHLAASRPDLIRSLTLIDSTGIPFEFAPLVHLANLAIPRGALSFAHILARDFLRTGPSSVVLSLARLLRDDARPLMRRIKMPVLLLWGKHDPLVPARYAASMQREMPHARVVIVPKAGHVPMWENPLYFNDALLAFLRDAESQAEEQESVRGFLWGIAGWTNGIAYRAAGTKHDVVLIHGLGMSSAYFDRFARALYERGYGAIAPDLPGFGKSADARASTPEEQAHTLAQWADALKIRNAIWIGHSAGCYPIVHLARLRPDLIRSVFSMSPLWSERSSFRLLPLLLIDALREPLAIWPYVLSAYWRCGLARWIATLWKSRHDHVPAGTIIAGERDPLVDRDYLRDIISVPGAHACHFSHPDQTADSITAAR